MNRRSMQHQYGPRIVPRRRRRVGRAFRCNVSVRDRCLVSLPPCWSSLLCSNATLPSIAILCCMDYALLGVSSSLTTLRTPASARWNVDAAFVPALCHQAASLSQPNLIKQKFCRFSSSITVRSKHDDRNGDTLPFYKLDLALSSGRSTSPSTPSSSSASASIDSSPLVSHSSSWVNNIKFNSPNSNKNDKNGNMNVQNGDAAYIVEGIRRPDQLNVQYQPLKDSVATATNLSRGKRYRDVQFISPLLRYGYRLAVEEWEKGYNVQKPLLLYLPGFDGTFLSPFLQFAELHTIFDVRCLTVGPRDRSTFAELRDSVVEFLQSILTETATVPLTRSTENISSNDKDGDVVAVNGRTNGSNNSNNNRGPVKNTATSKTTMGGRGAPAGGGGVGFLVNLLGGGNSHQKSKQLRTQRSLYLAGESFGGILACEVALTLLNQTWLLEDPVSNVALSLQGLTLINAATCYDRSRLAALGPAVADLHPWLYPTLGFARLLPLFTDEYSFDQLILLLQGKALPSVIDNPMREAYMGRVALSLPFVIPYLSQETLKWRLAEWLDTGCALMATKLPELAVQKYQARYQQQQNPNSPQQQQPATSSSTATASPAALPILIVAGEKDGTLPSIAEAERLASLLPNSVVHVVEGAGHASTCGSRVDLAAVMRNRFVELQAIPIPPPEEELMVPGMFATLETSDEFKSRIVDSDKIVPGRPLRSSKKRQSRQDIVYGRTSMKRIAAEGRGKYFGLEPRYDNQTIGLSPFKYWDPEYYRKL